MRASRASWLTHADTSVIAGRFERSSSSTASGSGGGAAAWPAATPAAGAGRGGGAGGRPRGEGGAEPGPEAPARGARVAAGGRGELLDGGRLGVGDPEDGGAGQPLAPRRVVGCRLALPPRRHRLGD